jgi:hypothetical protein
MGCSASKEVVNAKGSVTIEGNNKSSFKIEPMTKMDDGTEVGIVYKSCD